MIWNSLLREPLRKLLLRLLIFTEKKGADKPEMARQGALLRRDIHIPPALVLLLSSIFLLLVFLVELGWSWRSFFSIFFLVFLIVSLFTFYLRHDFPQMIQDDEAMMLLGTLIILFVLIVGSIKSWELATRLTPLPAASILAALLLHPRLAIVATMILSLIFSILHGLSFGLFFSSFFAGMAGVASAVYIRTQKDFIRTGAVIAGVNLLSVAILDSYTGRSLHDFLWQSLWTALNGFLSAILALGLLPFLESFFSRLTPLKLLELADFNQPLLKRLMVEAPGTYHHSLIMATLAEGAAQAIGANPLLCRVGAYYHDIGKLVKPEYFIENQGNLAQNPHDDLAPALSSLVVISHVKEGMALAQAAKLPAEISNFIPMHHGTSRIEYFYHQAKEDAQEELFRNREEDKGEPEVGEETYRYPGPKPLTKETAIVMLADSVEAIARTVEEPTHLRLQDAVGAIFSKKYLDGQLANSPLTLSDLDRIKDSFVKTLTSIYHERIKYPEEESA